MKFTNIHNLPQSLVNAVSNDPYAGPKGESERISVTTLIDSPKIHWLKVRHWNELTEDVSGRLWALLGTSVHHTLERAEDNKTIKEERIEEMVDGIVVSGQLDILGENKIEDWKTTSTYTILYNPNGKPEWVKQLNIYAWLAFKKGFKITELVINAILRDHQSKEVEHNPDYPKIPFKSISLPVWSVATTEAYIKERVAKVLACKDMPDEQLPDCTDEECWAKAGVWALMKKGRKSAVKLYATKEEAEANLGPDMSVVERPGTRNRCDSYCAVKGYCKQYAEYKKQQE